MVIIEASNMLKIALRNWIIITDDNQKMFAILLADRLPDPCTPHDFLITAQQLASDLQQRVISDSPLSGQVITFLRQVYTWPVGQMTSDFTTELSFIAQ